MKGPLVRKRKKVKGPVEEASEEVERRTGEEDSEDVHSAEELSRKRRKSRSPGRVGKKVSCSIPERTLQACMAALTKDGLPRSTGVLRSALSRLGGSECSLGFSL